MKNYELLRNCCYLLINLVKQQYAAMARYLRSPIYLSIYIDVYIHINIYTAETVNKYI